jgi:hypothetical protein
MKALGHARRSLVGCALLLQGCLGSCARGSTLAEREADGFVARLRCETVRNAQGVGPSAARAPAVPAYSAHVVLSVESSRVPPVRAPVPGGAMSDDDQVKLDASCRSLVGRIEVRSSRAGTVFAASLAGQRQSAVILRAPNDAVFAALAPFDGDATTAAARHPAPIETALDALLRGSLRDVASSPMLDALDDRLLRERRAPLLATAERCEAPVWLVERLVRQAPEETADRLFEGAYVRGLCSPNRLALESSTHNLVARRVERWIAEHGGRTSPWPVGIRRWADEHGIAGPSADASARE